MDSSGREFLFVDNNVIGRFVVGEFPLLNVYLLHPKRRVYFSRLVSNEYKSWRNRPVSEPPAPFQFLYAYGKESTVERAADYVQAEANMRESDFLKIRPDIKIVLEISVLLPEEFEFGVDWIPKLLTNNAVLYRSFLANEGRTRLLAAAIEIFGLDHMIEINWSQDLGLLNLDYEYIKQTLEEGPYAGIAKFDAEHFPLYFEKRKRKCVKRSGKR